MSEDSIHVTVDETASVTPAEERFLNAVQALLFASHEPVPAATLCAANGQTGWGLDRVVEAINERLESGSHPMRVRQVAGGYQMYLMPEYAPIVEAHLVKTKTQRLSRAGLETLAIVAYRQPCTTPQIEHVRGVACDGVLRTLLERNLLTIKGRSDAAGRPLLYATTPEFLRYFGLGSIDELPGEDQLEELMSARTPDEGDPLAAYTDRVAPASTENDLFGTIILKRGPERSDGSAGSDASDDGRFVVSDLCAASDQTGWNIVPGDDAVHVVVTDVDEESDAVPVSDEPLSRVADVIDSVEEPVTILDGADGENELLPVLNEDDQDQS